MDDIVSTNLVIKDNGSWIKLKNEIFLDKLERDILEQTECEKINISFSCPLVVRLSTTNILLVSNVDTLISDSIRRLIEFHNDIDSFVSDSELKIKISNNCSLLHEYFIGSYGVNYCREFIPNFAYTIGYFRFGEDKELHKWYEDSPSYNELNSCYRDYLLTEKLNFSITLDEYISHDLDPISWLNVYLQIIYSLNEANRLVGFTHYNLNTENVLIRIIPGITKMSIGYNTENGFEYINTKFIATIVNYDNAHIKYKGKHYSKIGQEEYGILPINNPMYDSYTLLMFSAKKALEVSNKRLFDIIQTIFKFFSKSDLAESVKEQQEYKYFLPLSKQLEKVNLLDLSKHIRLSIGRKDFNTGSTLLGRLITSFPLYEVKNDLSADINILFQENNIYNLFNKFNEILYLIFKNKNKELIIHLDLVIRIKNISSKLMHIAKMIGDIETQNIINKKLFMVYSRYPNLRLYLDEIKLERNIDSIELDCYIEQISQMINKIGIHT